MPTPPLLDFFASKLNPFPKKFVPLDPLLSISILKNTLLKTDAGNDPKIQGGIAGNTNTNEKVDNLKMRIIKEETKALVRTTELDPAAIPPSSIFPILSEKKLELPSDIPNIEVQANGPYYIHGYQPSDIEFLLKSTPTVMDSHPSMQRKQYMENISENSSKKFLNVSEQAEIVRRILSMENASSGQMKKFNIQRCIELFGDKPFNSGSSAVQIAVFTLKIWGMENHIYKNDNKKDKDCKRTLQIYMSKREKMMKYLRRKNLQEYVKVCEALSLRDVGIVQQT